MVAIAVMVAIGVNVSMTVAGIVFGVLVLSLVTEPLAGVYLAHRRRMAARPRVPKARVVSRRRR